MINEYHQAAYMLQRNVIPAIPPRDRANFQEDALPELIPTGCVLGTIQSVDMYDLRGPTQGPVATSHHVPNTTAPNPQIRSPL